jgi:hypothetical protein
MVPLRARQVAMAKASSAGLRRGVAKAGARRRKSAEPAADVAADPAVESPAALVAAVGAAGLTPLDYMLRVLRDESASPAARMNAAKCAAPYIHARLASTEFKAPGLDKIGDAMAGLLKRAQESGGGVAGLVRS